MFIIYLQFLKWFGKIDPGSQIFGSIQISATCYSNLIKIGGKNDPGS